MRIAITGSDGFIGSHLSRFFAEKGHVTIPLVKSDFLVDKLSVIRSKLQGCDAVINLAGAGIGKRWTTEYKQLIYSSRITTTKLLVSAINTMDNKPSLLVSASAVGYYPSGRTYTDEEGVHGTDFLAKVCADWENEAREVHSQVRLVLSRFGTVLAPDGGAFPKMLLPFRMGLGGRIGSGSQYFAWIHIRDLMEAVLFVIENSALKGPVNFTAPEVTTNQQFCREAAALLHVPCCVSVPRFVFRAVLGEGYTVVVGGKSAFPKKLLDAGYKFRYPDIRDALKDLLSESGEDRPCKPRPRITVTYTR